MINKLTQHWNHDQFRTVMAMPESVIQPINNDEVMKVVKYANDHNSTDLMGANLTIKGSLLLDMIKMNQVLEYDPESIIMTVQAEIRLKNIQEYLADKPFTYMSALAMHWAIIGGNVSINAGA